MKRTCHRNQRGWTLVELVLASVILSILVVAVAPVFNMTQRGFTSVEARSALKISGQEAVNKLNHKLVECKRLFENSANDLGYLARVQLSTAPAVLANSRLPSLEETGAISPSSGSFVAASVGNSLFFASIDRARDLTVLDAGGNSCNVRIDMYVFNYYYLSPENGVSVGGQPKRELWEWHSGLYADYNQLMALTDTTKRANVAIALRNGGVTVAWDPTATISDNGFYTLNVAGAIISSSVQLLALGSAREMIVLQKGAVGGYRYGVAPNHPTLQHPVPHFGTVNNNFPSGFEVVAVGPNSARLIFIRLVLMAEGSFGGNMSSEQTVLTTVRDLW